jgi:hypothetical protein
MGAGWAGAGLTEWANAALLFALLSVLGGSLYAAVAGVRALLGSLRARGQCAQTLVSLGLSLCEPLVNLAAFFTLSVTLFGSATSPQLLPLTTPLAALLLPLLHLHPGHRYRLLHLGLLLQGLARGTLLLLILLLPDSAGGWFILWFGASWYAGLWGAQQVRALLDEPLR